MEMMLQTQNLCKYFRKQKAVNNVSLNIEKGQIYGLLGPNGAGKSTTLKMLTGMMKPTAGKIYFDGKLWDRKDLSKIGALIENPPIYENLSIPLPFKLRCNTDRSHGHNGNFSCSFSLSITVKFSSKSASHCI